MARGPDPGDGPGGGSDPTTTDPARALLEANDLGGDRLAEVLADAGFTARLEGFEAELVGTGQVGENVRCRLRWADGAGTDRAGADGVGADGPPASVILKLPSSDPVSRATGGATRSYIREVGFYRDAAPLVDIRIPAIHHLWEDREANRFLLVMEDIHPAVTGDQLAGCDLAGAELAVDAAAALHGSTWGRTDLGRLDWVDVPSPDRAAERVELFAALWPGFVDRYRDRLAPDDLAFGRWLAQHYPDWQASRSEAQCLVHGDFRLDNVLFGQGPPAPAMTTVDWQTVSLGPALNDVAYFLSGALDDAVLVANEADLLARYRRGLAARGVEVTDRWTSEQYALGAPAGYVMAVIASQIVGQTERGDRMFLVMAAGSAGLARRLDVPGRIG